MCAPAAATAVGLFSLEMSWCQPDWGTVAGIKISAMQTAPVAFINLSCSATSL